LTTFVAAAIVFAGCGGTEAPAAPREPGLSAPAVAQTLVDDGLGAGHARVSDVTGLLTAHEVVLGARSKAILRTEHVVMFVDVFDSADSAAAVHATHVEECPSCLMALCGPVFVVARPAGEDAAAASDIEEAQRLLEGRYGPC
jgi:hypothetical protein